MQATMTDRINWRASPKKFKTLRHCGTTGRFLEPHELRRCPHGCEPLSWRLLCRVCGSLTEIRD